METNLYTVTVPPFVRALRAMKASLVKGEAHAKARTSMAMDEATTSAALLDSRLVFDQFPLIRQIQIATDNAKNGVARISGAEAPKHDDKETTFAELYARIDSTIAFLEAIKPQMMIGQEAKEISHPYWGDKKMYAHDYAIGNLIPNFYFHVTTAHDIMRANGVVVTKEDYFGERKFI